MFPASFSVEIILIFLLIGLSVLAIGKGSDWLSDSLIPIAKRLGVSGVAVGLILVSVAVSLPEILVSIYTTLRGSPAMGLGVVLGSIICNIGLMTGLSALIRPLAVTRQTILRDGIFSITVPILVFAVSSGGSITRVEGLAFFVLFIPYVVNVFLQEGRKTDTYAGQDVKDVVIRLQLLGFDFGKLKSGWLSFLLGLGLLLVGAQVFSIQLIDLAKKMEINELFIGLTLGALGPSIPNIMAAVQAARKGMGEIAVSETLGSNIFTLLVTLGILAMLSPISMTEEWLSFDLPATLFMSFLLFAFLLTGKTISRLEGGILLAAYLFILVLQGVFYVS